MSMRLVSVMSILVPAMGLTLLTACNSIQPPRFTHPTEQPPVIPLSIKLVFDESVRSAIVEQTVCADQLWKGRLGDAIVQSFSEAGRARVTHLTIEDSPGGAQSAAAPASGFTALITLASASFEPTSRAGSADSNYLAQFDVHLSAAFQDDQGRRFPKAPMVYSHRVALWTPQIGGSDNRCGTGQLDAATRTAADHLAGQFMGYLAQLQEKSQGEGISGRLSPGAWTNLALKATFLDANNNLLLEGGEKIGVRIDVTNTGKVTLNSLAIVLSGTPALMDAFAGKGSSPAQIGNLQPGETKSTILWGALPADTEGSRGELTVAVTPSGAANGAPATQTLIAAMTSRGAKTASPPSSTVQQASTTARDLRNPDRYAVIVGLDQYRTHWAGWRDGLSSNTKETISLFAESLNIPEGQTLLLQDEVATQADVEKALSLWLPKRVTKDSIIFFYFSGQARGDANTGEIFLMPYDSTPQSPPFRVLSLRFLQQRLVKLGARLVVAIIEAPVTMGAAAKNNASRLIAPNWIGDLDGSSDVGAGAMLQISRRSPSTEARQSLLSGLTGKADRDGDGTVTVGEWLRSLRSIAVTTPALPPDLAIQSIPLSRVTQP